MHRSYVLRATVLVIETGWVQTMEEVAGRILRQRRRLWVSSVQYRLHYHLQSHATVLQCKHVYNWTELMWTELNWTAVNWSEQMWTELMWTELSWDELSWAELSWAELNWTELKWTELSWAELNWTELNWTELTPAQSDAKSRTLDTRCVCPPWAIGESFPLFVLPRLSYHFPLPFFIPFPFLFPL